MVCAVFVRRFLGLNLGFSCLLGMKVGLMVWFGSYELFFLDLPKVFFLFKSLPGFAFLVIFYFGPYYGTFWGIFFSFYRVLKHIQD